MVNGFAAISFVWSRRGGVVRWSGWKMDLDSVRCCAIVNEGLGCLRWRTGSTAAKLVGLFRFVIEMGIATGLARVKRSLAVGFQWR